MIKYLIMDVDGTLTDGKIHMGELGETHKSFNIKDGYGIRHILPEFHIEPIILTGRESKIVLNRCKELHIKEVFQGISDKESFLRQLQDAKNFSWYELAYIGDDVNDYDAMCCIKSGGGIVGCPHDSVQKILEIADYVCAKPGGDGAVREFIEFLTDGERERNSVLIF